MTSVVVFGDSYVAAAERGRPGFARLLPLLLLWRGEYMGRGGTGFVKTSGGRLAYPERLAALIATNADVAVIQSSGNDAPCDLGEVDIVARQFLATVSGAFRETYVIGPMWAVEGADNLPALALAIRRICSDLDIPFLDAADWLRPNRVAEDGAHPTWLGHARIASEAAMAIRRARRPAHARFGSSWPIS